MKQFVLGALAACALFILPAAASAADGFATANVNMRSGPSTRYPAVVVIPAGAPVRIFGCLADVPWCDVSYARIRGWVAGRYVQAVYRQNRVYVDPQYYEPLGIPTIVFDMDNYWDRNYRGRDFYRDRDRWRREPRPGRDIRQYDRDPNRRDNFGNFDRPGDDHLRDRNRWDRQRNLDDNDFGNVPPRREDGVRNRDRNRIDNGIDDLDINRDRDRNNRRDRQRDNAIGQPDNNQRPSILRPENNQPDFRDDAEPGNRRRTGYDAGQPRHRPDCKPTDDGCN